MLHFVDLGEQAHGDLEKDRQELAKQLLESNDPDIVKIGEKIQNFAGMEDFEGIITSLMEFNQKYDKKDIEKMINEAGAVQGGNGQVRDKKTLG